MKVFKFGGASVRNAGAIRQVAHILSQNTSTPLLVVISAMGKTTNALERVHAAFQNHQPADAEIALVMSYHRSIAEELMGASAEAKQILNEFEQALHREASRKGSWDETYDQLVSWGEWISTQLVSCYLRTQGIHNQWLDARTCIVTDSNYREANVDWAATTSQIQNLTWKAPVMITQGFVGKTSNGHTTTLGRDGSDFSAAIFAHGLNAESVTIWKDVPGVMNADPKRLPAATVFEELPFKEAAEMTYYGASVIHPKTIKPLANKGIPLLVKNFDDPALPGTRITECKVDDLPPLIVFKDNQCLVTCKVTDYTFVNEAQMSTILHALAEHDVHINLLQNSAITFSFCADYREEKIMKLIGHLGKSFEVYYNTGLTLITVKNYDAATFQEYRTRPGVLLEQSSRSTLQVLVKS